MAQRQPEGVLKDTCRDISKENGLLFWQIEGKSRNGVPDTLASKMSGGAVLIEFKRKGKLPNEQQWLRIYELRQEGIDAWYADSVEMYEMLVGLRPRTFSFTYPPKIQALIKLGTAADDARGYAKQR